MRLLLREDVLCCSLLWLLEWLCGCSSSAGRCLQLAAACACPISKCGLHTAWVLCCVLQQHRDILTSHTLKVIAHVHCTSAAAAAAAVSGAAAGLLAATVLLLLVLLHRPWLLLLPLVLQWLLCCIQQVVLAMCLSPAKLHIC